MEQKRERKKEKRKDFKLNKKKQARINLIMHLKKSSCKQQKNLTYSMNSLHTEGAHVAYKTIHATFTGIAKTIHSFQGATVGPTPPERPENNFLHIVADPGTKQFESQQMNFSTHCSHESQPLVT